MAAVAGVCSNAFGFNTPAGPKTATTESTYAGRIENCIVPVTFTGTYEQGANAFTISNANLAAAISGSRRDGATITILGATGAAPGLEGTTTPTFTYPLVVTYAAVGNAVTGQLYGADLATEHAATAMLAYTAPILFSVTFSAQENV